MAATGQSDAPTQVTGPRLLTRRQRLDAAPRVFARERLRDVTAVRVPIESDGATVWRRRGGRA